MDTECKILLSFIVFWMVSAYAEGVAGAFAGATEKFGVPTCPADRATDILFFAIVVGIFSLIALCSLLYVIWV